MRTILKVSKKHLYFEKEKKKTRAERFTIINTSTSFSFIPHKEKKQSSDGISTILCS